MQYETIRSKQFCSQSSLLMMFTPVEAERDNDIFSSVTELTYLLGREKEFIKGKTSFFLKLRKVEWYWSEWFIHAVCFTGTITEKMIKIWTIRGLALSGIKLHMICRLPGGWGPLNKFRSQLHGPCSKFTENDLCSHRKLYPIFPSAPQRY